jgi:trk system potassium uptake protein TrkA
VVGDATDRSLLDEIGADGADAAVISTGGDLAASILATQALRDLGVEEIYVKVTSEEAPRALETLGVTETIFPEREVAYRLAHRLPSKTIMDYIPLAERHPFQELAIPDAWLGRSLRDLALPRQHGIQVVALYDVPVGQLDVVPDPDQPLEESDVAIVAGSEERIQAVLADVEAARAAAAGPSLMLASRGRATDGRAHGGAR